MQQFQDSFFMLLQNTSFRHINLKQMSENYQRNLITTSAKIKFFKNLEEDGIHPLFHQEEPLFLNKENVGTSTSQLLTSGVKKHKGKKVLLPTRAIILYPSSQISSTHSGLRQFTQSATIYGTRSPVGNDNPSLLIHPETAEMSRQVVLGKPPRMNHKGVFQN